jgi:hypothetical protein
MPSVSEEALESIVFCNNWHISAMACKGSKWSFEVGKTLPYMFIWPVLSVGRVRKAGRSNLEMVMVVHCRYGNIISICWTIVESCIGPSCVKKVPRTIYWVVWAWWTVITLLNVFMGIMTDPTIVKFDVFRSYSHAARDHVSTTTYSRVL